MQKTKKFRRLLAALLAVLMLSIGIPAMAFATGEKGVRPTFQFVDVADGHTVDTVYSSVVLEYNKEYTFDVISTYKMVPDGYEFAGPDDWTFTIKDAENTTVMVEVQKIATTAVVNVRFMDGDEFVAGGDYTLPLGTQNRSILEQYVPEGYKMTESGDIYVEEGKSLTISVEKIATTGIMNVRFMDGDEFVAGGDYTLPLGTQNYSVLEQYVPEGYKMSVSGDFAVTDGGKIDVAVEKIATTGIMNVRFMDGDEFVAGGDYILPLGTQNYSVLEQYVPEGYKMSVSGDFAVIDGGKIEVPVERIDNGVIMNIRFMDGDEFVAGGDYMLTEGVHNYNDLAQYVPSGYEMEVSGDFMASEGAKLEVPIKPVVDKIIMNIRFMYGDEFIAGGDYTLTEGVHKYSELADMGLVPEGYVLEVAGDFMAAEGAKLEVAIIPDTKTVGLNFFDEENYEQVCEVEVEVPYNAIHLNTSEISKYLPEGYELIELGDLSIRDGWIYVGVKCNWTLKIYWAIDNEQASFANGNDNAWTQELTWMHADDEMAMPEINVNDGYKLNGWSVSGESGEFWTADLASVKELSKKCVKDENGGYISITANVVKADEATSGNTNTVTASSDDSSDEVVKAEAPADNSTKILPQTGNQGVVSPVSFVVVLCAALAGAAVYLFAIRKKLN